MRLRIFPDGGVARLRVYGDVMADWDALRRQGEIDLAALVHGARVVDMQRHVLRLARQPHHAVGPARHGATAGRPSVAATPGHDWTVVRLGARGTITRVEVDTRHFKGNAPGACSLDACTAAAPERDWQELLPRTPLQADCRHAFDKT